MTTQTVHIQELTRPTHWFCCRCWAVNPITTATCPTFQLPSNTLCTHRLTHCDTTRCLRLDPRSASLFTTFYTDWLTPQPRPLYTYTCHNASHTRPLIELLTGSNLCCGTATLLSEVRTPGWTVNPAIDSWTASLGIPENVRRWQRWMYTCEEVIPTERKFKDKLDDFWDGEERHPDWADDWIFWGNDIPGPDEGPPDDPEGDFVETRWGPVSIYAGGFGVAWGDVGEEDSGSEEDGEEESEDESEEESDTESEEEMEEGVDLTLPRCLPCLKLKDKEEKNGCDRQQPICGRCNDAGLSAEECIPEGKGNLRNGLYGRQPVKLVMQTVELPAAPGPIPTTETTVAANAETAVEQPCLPPAAAVPIPTTVEQPCLPPAAPTPTPMTETTIAAGSEENGKVFDSNKPLAPTSPPTSQLDPTPVPNQEPTSEKKNRKRKRKFHNSYATRAEREARKRANAKTRADLAEIDAIKEYVKELEREAEELMAQ